MQLNLLLHAMASKATSMSEARLGVWTAQNAKPGMTHAPISHHYHQPHKLSLKMSRKLMCNYVFRAWMPQIWRDKGCDTEVTEVNVNTPLAPSNILKMIRCTYSSETPCKTSSCGCNNAKFPCTFFCLCQNTYCLLQ